MEKLYCIMFRSKFVVNITKWKNIPFKVSQSTVLYKACNANKIPIIYLCKRKQGTKKCFATQMMRMMCPYKTGVIRHTLES